MSSSETKKLSRVQCSHHRLKPLNPQNYKLQKSRVNAETAFQDGVVQWLAEGGGMEEDLNFRLKPFKSEQD